MTKEQIQELLDVFKEKSYEELLVLAGESAYKILPVFDRLGDDNLDGTTLLLLFIGYSLASDKKLSKLEIKYSFEWILSIALLNSTPDNTPDL